MQKTCSNCSQAAQFSLVAIISSVGVSGRLQKSCPAVLFCDSCLQELCELLCSDELYRSVNSALTALNERLRERMNAGNSTS
jgi:hypothetical protein